ncbi:hypothetical protein AB5I41_18245 [Sphingomonas sp. MMS24-JH45]
MIPTWLRSSRTWPFHKPVDSWAVQLPFTRGRLWGGDARARRHRDRDAAGQNSDYIKRVIGLPGETGRRCAAAW